MYIYIYLSVVALIDHTYVLSCILSALVTQQESIESKCFSLTAGARSGPVCDDVVSLELQHCGQDTNLAFVKHNIFYVHFIPVRMCVFVCCCCHKVRTNTFLTVSFSAIP